VYATTSLLESLVLADSNAIPVGYVMYFRFLCMTSCFHIMAHSAGCFKRKLQRAAPVSYGHHKKIAGMAIFLLLTGIYLFSRFALLKTGVDGGICKG